MTPIKYSIHKLLMFSTLILLLISSFSLVLAETSHHKLVIQVSSNDPVTQTIALNNAVNLQKHYGMDNITIEIVAFGPGLGFMTTKSKQADRIKSLVLQDIQFSACANTMKKMTKKTGKQPVLVEGVGVVPAGAARIIELQEQDYSYLRP